MPVGGKHWSECTAAALDIESNGSKFRLGDRAFALYAHDTNDRAYEWHWEIDPVKRTTVLPREIRREIIEFTSQYDVLVFHNAKFDVTGLHFSGINFSWRNKTDDTMIMSHVLDNVGSHELKDLAVRYLRYPKDDQKELKVAVDKARYFARKYFPDWKLADEHSDSKGKGTKIFLDYWLPKMVAERLGRDFFLDYKYPPKFFVEIPHIKPEDVYDYFMTVCDKYGRGDVKRTIELWWTLNDGLDSVGLREQYNDEIELLCESLYDTENKGITVSALRMKSELKRFIKERDRLEACMREMAPDVNFASDDQLCELLFGVPKRCPETGQVQVYVESKSFEGIKRFDQLKKGDSWTALFESREGSFELEPVRLTKQRFSTDNKTRETLLKQLDEDSEAHYYLTYHSDWKDVDKAIQQVKTFKRHLSKDNRVYSIFGQCATKTTRMNAKNPSIHTVSKGKEIELESGDKTTKYKLRTIFGPRSGRVWYCPDYSQLQLRIFAVMANETSMIEAFDRGEDLHTFTTQKFLGRDNITSIERRDIGKTVNFSFIFGKRFPAEIARQLSKVYPSAHKYMRKIKSEVQKNGYVYTLDGYRLWIPYENGRLQSHKGVNYIDQGTEGRIVKKAMTRTSRYLKSEEIYEHCQIEPNDAFLTFQVHDELVFDFPAETFKGQHLPALQWLKHYMEEPATEMGVHAPVDFELVTSRSNWAEGKKFDVPSLELIS